MPAPKRTPALRKHLQGLDREALQDELERLAERFPQVKKFLLADLSGDTAAIVAAARIQLERCFKTSTGKWRRARSSKLNSILREFETISVFEEDVLDLLVYRLALTAPWLNEFRPPASPLIQSSIRTFERACELARSLQVKEKYGPQLRALVPRFDDRQLREALESVLVRNFDAP